MFGDGTLTKMLLIWQKMTPVNGHCCPAIELDLSCFSLLCIDITHDEPGVASMAGKLPAMSVPTKSSSANYAG
jgi:hypothetical protein